MCEVQRFRGQKAVELKKLFLEFAQLQLKGAGEDCGPERHGARDAAAGQAPVRRADPCKHVRVGNSFGLDKNDAIGVTKSTASTQSPLAAAAPTSYPRRRRPSPSDVPRPLCNVCIFVLFLLLSATKQSPSPEAHGSTYSAPITVNSSSL
ncbi:hypothetical protein PF003_g22669 [Phytophthora fragariae]|nr:hypothetical protein PF003_g22669 [Phytophthora fragariae]